MSVGTDESSLLHVVSIFDLLLKDETFTPVHFRGSRQYFDFICLNTVVIKGNRHF